MRKLLCAYAAPFGGVYVASLALLFIYRWAMGYSDYVIPSPSLVLEAFGSFIWPYSLEALLTIAISGAGYAASLAASIAVASAVFFSGRFKGIILSASHTIQSFPLVAVAPIIFTILGQNFFTSVFVAALICYFPMLLALLGALSSPIEEVEHFYVSCGRSSKPMLFKIRIIENLANLITILKSCVTLAVVGAVISEFLSMDKGIGFVIRVSSVSNKMEQTLVALFSIGLVNTLMLWLADLVGIRIVKIFDAEKGKQLF